LPWRGMIGVAVANVASSNPAPVPVEVAVKVFFEEHRRCDELIAGGVEPGRVWMTCDGCGAEMVRRLEEPRKDK